jgi:hypothetical protein
MFALVIMVCTSHIPAQCTRLDDTRRFETVQECQHAGYALPPKLIGRNVRDFACQTVADEPRAGLDFMRGDYWSGAKHYRTPEEAGLSCSPGPCTITKDGLYVDPAK